ncbi:MAG: DUF3786 domain-containing protein [Treponema sp.]|jgi:hypothetical protein|nr:DUF3786 domain-containing protein [Treponema sp.]
MDNINHQDRRNQKDEVPLTHYRGIYKTLEPEAIAQRCGLSFDPAESVFALRLMGTEYLVTFPDFQIQDRSGTIVQSAAENILLLRYLCEGNYGESQGKQLSYHDIPWGEVYYRNFEGRCLKRFAYTFGNDPAALRRIMEETKSLRAEPLGKGDAGYRFEFMSGLYMSLLLWAGDEEFPPSSQMLFDDNFISAFTAEDIAVVGEVVIGRLKGMRRAGN